MSDKFIIETSARHTHVCEKDLEILFGKGYKLTPKKDLSQLGQFACEEKVTVVGPRGETKMSILGPTRNATQVELSLTDARSIGITAPIRESGNTVGTPGCKIVGPCGEVEISEGVIVAKRHIHMTKADAIKLGVKDKDIVNVQADGCTRPLVFGDVVVRVSDSFALAMHVDTDECNCAGLDAKSTGYIMK